MKEKDDPVEDKWRKPINDVKQRADIQSLYVQRGGFGRGVDRHVLL